MLGEPWNLSARPYHFAGRLVVGTLALGMVCPRHASRKFIIAQASVVVVLLPRCILGIRSQHIEHVATLDKASDARSHGAEVFFQHRDSCVRRLSFQSPPGLLLPARTASGRDVHTSMVSWLAHGRPTGHGASGAFFLIALKFGQWAAQQCIAFSGG